MNQYIHLHIKGNASTAIKLWENLVEKEYPKKNIPIIITWEGETDLEPHELGQKIGRILAKMGLSILTLKNTINIVEELKKEFDT